ncbi:MAG: DUF488 domain-containing protein [Anaerolinea sp.]|nr:DUF488 domain-containing protein [Anaerolinea sp.]
MHATIYTLGYSKVKIEDLETVIRRDELIVIDTRFNPYSPNPAWRKGALAKRLGDHYRHVHAFGNRLYKQGGIELVDVAAGIEQVLPLLEKGVSIVLLCACADITTCHRRVVAEALAEASGCPVVHWTPDDLRPMQQAGLFDP